MTGWTDLVMLCGSRMSHARPGRIKGRVDVDGLLFRDRVLFQTVITPAGCSHLRNRPASSTRRRARRRSRRQGRASGVLGLVAGDTRKMLRVELHHPGRAVEDLQERLNGVGYKSGAVWR
jgi:hypothetical protein